MDSLRDNVFTKLVDNAKKNRIPLACTLEITTKCNFECIHCYLRNCNKVQMKKEDAISYIDQARKLGGKFLTITGGEPLTHPDFKEIYEYAFQKGFLINVFTNASLLNNEVIKMFSKYRLLKVEITLYGASPSTYEDITGKKEYYNRVRNSMDLLKSHNISFLTKVVAMDKNKNDLYKIQKIANEYDSQFKWDFKLMPRMDGDRTPLNYRLSAKEAVDLEIKIDDCKITRWTSNFKKWKNELSVNNDRKLFRCGCGNYSYMISAESKMRMCNFLDNTEVNLKENTIEEAWIQFGKYNSIKKDINDKCTTCEYRILCDICPSISYSIVNDFNMKKSVDFQCEVAKERFKRIKNEVV